MSTVHRAVALTIFSRAVASITDRLEAHNEENAKYPDLKPIKLDPELITDFAMMAVIGPPPSEIDLISGGDADPELIPEEVLDKVLPLITRATPVALLAEEILAAMIQAPADGGWSEDREIKTCQMAMHIEQEQYPDPENDPRTGARQDWDVCRAWLMNHDDGHWMVMGLAVDDEDES